jgi:hypothetical protein
VFRSDDGGVTFNYLSRVPCSSKLRYCAEAILGPSEPAIAQLPGGDLMLLFRVTGRPCYSATSSDQGLTWTTPTETPIWSVWPELLVLSNGILVATSGRPGIGFWYTSSTAASYSDWIFVNLANEHNTLQPNNLSNHYNGLNVACEAFNCPSCWIPGEKCSRQTTSYTGLVELSPGTDRPGDGGGRNATVLISYDRLANGWFGPPGVCLCLPF